MMQSSAEQLENTAGREHPSRLVRSTDDGIHLTGSILWFDAYSRGDLSFLSSAIAPHGSRVPQVLATDETVRLLEALRRRPNALVCQYNRPFSIGRLQMELLPAGNVLGGASLYLETERGRVLYAPAIQTQRIPTVRQVQVKRSGTLIIGAHHGHASESLPPRKRERDRLLTTVVQHVKNGKTPIILCKAVGTAQEITQLLTKEGISPVVHPTIKRLNRVYQACGSDLGDHGLFDSKRSRPSRPILWPWKERAPLRQALPRGEPVLTIYDSLTPTGRLTFPSPKDTFFLSTMADGPELKEVVNAVCPKELLITGPYAKSYALEFRGLCTRVAALFPNDQPTLF